MSKPNPKSTERDTLILQMPIIGFKSELSTVDRGSTRLVEDADENTIPASFEFRTFWWKGECVGTGRYWLSAQQYDWTQKEKQDALSIAGEAARRVNVPFLVVDVAQRIDGQWIVIECNDGHESGYAGVSPFALWKNIITFEQKLSANQ